MTEAMPFLQKYDITFLRPPPISMGPSFCNLLSYSWRASPPNDAVIHPGGEPVDQVIHHGEY